MMLKNIFGKTIDAALKSAQQMYGDDVLVVDSEEPAAAGEQAKITVMQDQKNKQAAAIAQQQKAESDSATAGRSVSGAQSPKEFRLPADALDESEAVKFERSSHAPRPSQPTTAKAPAQKPLRNATKPKANKLDSLRAYAKQLEQREFNTKRPVSLDDTITEGYVNKKKAEKTGSENPSGTVYSRSLVRPKTDIDHLKEAIEKQPDNDPEIKTLYKRFDKLEALLDSSLLSAEMKYSSHPAFRQLEQTGIPSAIIADWFKGIEAAGTDPFMAEKEFMVKLGGIIRKALGEISRAKTKKHLMFVGPGGAGKTNLIMKLAGSKDFATGKQLAVAVLYPQDEEKLPYYSVLPAFCEDHDIECFHIRNAEELKTAAEVWEDFDHVFIDTPSLSSVQNESFREYWQIRQKVSGLPSLEVHYVVNASLRNFHFKDASSLHHPLQPASEEHPLQPDYVDITHLDEVSQWGPVIPFLKEMGYRARFLSTGIKGEEDLKEFNPQWFVQKVLHGK